MEARDHLQLLFAHGARRDRARAAGAEEVETRVYYRPFDELVPSQASVAEAGTPVAADLYRRLLCLPMANDLSADEVATIAASIDGSDA